MMQQEQLYDRVFGGASAGMNRVEHIRRITSKYPYFSLAHYFLLKETPENHSDRDSIAGRTVLHIHHPFHLQFLLTEHLAQPEPNKEEIPLLQQATEDKAEAIPSFMESMGSQPKTFEGISHGEKIISEMAEAIAQKIADQQPVQPSVEAVAELQPVVQDAAAPKAVEATETLLFEPLHTTDYFASQGIKLSEDLQSGDKLGKQLKSFTEWLKTMKKVHTQKSTEDLAVPLDPTVSRLAENSNQEQDVLTETMAEVYLQQGKKSKARDIYQKLSLQNPAKSAYFAAKIDSLNEK